MTADEHWNYSEDSGHGPSAWTRLYPAGKAQSPINILIDYCDLHQSACTNCQRLPLSTRLQGGLKITSHQHQNDDDDDDEGQNYNNKHHQRRHERPAPRRGHLDSVGNENDSDELQSELYYQGKSQGGANSPSSLNSDQSAASSDNEQQRKAPLGASECLTLWKSKKLLSGPLQMRKAPHHHHQQVEPTKQQAQRQNTRYCVTNKKIFLGYPRFLNTIKLCNTGHGWQVDMPRELACHTLLCGPPLGDREYRLAQFHCHWGADCSHGSEHQLNGQSFSAELHFVHWDCSRFNSMAEAARHKKGLCVLAVFVQALEGEQSRNKHLDKLMGGIERVRNEPHASIELANTKLDLKKLFPVNRWDYATYEGSLTTPPLSEVVDWVVFLQPIQCSASQVAEFRRLQCPSGQLTRNCRPIQALNQRTVTIWTHSHSH